MRTAIEIADAVRNRELRAVEALEEVRAAIDLGNSRLRAFVHIDWDIAEKAARETDRRVSEGQEPGPLAGVPFGIKDLDDCAGMPTSHGSLVFKGSAPKAKDSPHVARLREAGAVPVGKTAPSEFGMDTATNTRAWGVTRNPWRLDRTPGGSSGGSASAVASAMIPLATSSDLGGSTRTPASFTGLVGLKPSQGRIPQWPSTSSCNALGVLTRTVADTARALDVMSGPVTGDVLALPRAGLSYERAIEELEVTGLRAAWSADLGFAVVEREVRVIAEEAAAQLADAADLELMPYRSAFTPPAPIILNTELPRWLAGLQSQGIWPEKNDLLSPACLWAVDYARSVPYEAFLRAELDLVKLRRELADFFTTYDVLLTPTVACLPYGADAPYPSKVEGQDVREITIEPFTELASLGWLPAISVPAGLSSDGLPIGLQIAAGLHRDDVVLRLARILEVAQPWPALAAT